jgi:hypothetical protein
VQKFEIYTRARITAAVFLFARTCTAHTYTEYHVAGAHNKEGAQRVMKRNNSKVYQRRAPSRARRMFKLAVASGGNFA